MDNLSTELFDDLRTRMVNCCGSLRPKTQVMAKSIGHKTEKQRDHTETRVNCNLTAKMWKDKQNINILLNVLFSASRG